MPAFVKGSETSEAASKSIRAERGRAAVLSVLRQHPGGLTDEEIQGLTGLSPSTERPRRVELWRDGLVAESGLHRKTTSGRSAVVWLAEPTDMSGFNKPESPREAMVNSRTPAWRERALLAEAGLVALRRTVDQLELELAKAQARTQPSPFFDLWGVPRRES